MKIFDFCIQEAELLKDLDTFTPAQHLLIIRFMEDACKKVRDATIEECRKCTRDSDGFPTDLDNIEV